jgi:hypothetical protein
MFFQYSDAYTAQKMRHPVVIKVSQIAVENELRFLWRAQQRAGLAGKMCLYSINGTRPWPTKSPGTNFWFAPEEVTQAAEFFLSHYNEGQFPFTALLLNPVVHEEVSAGEYRPLGSAVIWAQALDVADIAPDKIPRLKSVGAAVIPVRRMENPVAGIKLVACSPTPFAPQEDGMVEGCRALYDLADIKNEECWPYYLLSGVTYPSQFGSYTLAEFTAAGVETVFVTEKATDAQLDAWVKTFTITPNTLKEAAQCWEAYDRHTTLYARFGNDVKHLKTNLEFYHYCARDFELFDAVGAPRGAAGTQEEKFEFLVDGLIPRGSIVLLAATGGTGKSSLAHKLCCMVATDWCKDETPRWLGQPVNKAYCEGICIYFSGEDGPAIINARNALFDPDKRAKRLMFQRTDFTSAKGDKISFAEFLGRLRTMPNVPLLVIDPARKYLNGDEEDSAVVSEFFEAIEKFAHEKNAAVIVVHHLRKGARPSNIREVLDDLRGSQVFIDRPRVVIGMLREGPHTVVGLAKCNIPPSLGMVTAERVFKNDQKTLDLIQLPGKKGVRDPFGVKADEEE